MYICVLYITCYNAGCKIITIYLPINIPFITQVDDLLEPLHDGSVLTDDDIKEITAQPGDEAKVRALVDVLYNKPAGTLDALISALQDVVPQYVVQEVQEVHSRLKQEQEVPRGGSLKNSV